METAESTDAVDGAPTEAAIRQRAYEIYLSRNGAPGNAELDWLQAESEMGARRDAKMKP